MNCRKTLRIAALILPAFLLAACGGGADEAAVPPVADPATTLTIAQGTLVGYTQDVDEGALAAHVWLGIPFAAPPVGDLRWRAPRSPRDWDGTLEALEFSDWCVQITNGLDAGYGYEAGQILGSEDCLYLNVYAPADRGDEPLPVMVWIHGGGNVWGRASQYDASTLAARENVIVVTIQYRLGPLGWFAHPALRDTAEISIDRTANFGTMDMVASLLWVRDNIGVFGGDAGRVTIFGESAGGHDVASLLVAPQAEGLFHGAIIQSGGPETVSVAVAEGSAPDPLERGQTTSADAINTILAFIAPPTPEQLAGAMRSIDVDTLYGAYHRPNGNGDLSVDPYRVIGDGIVLPEDGMLAAMRTPGRYNQVPVIAGSNRDETRLFNALDDRFTNRYLGVIILPKSQRLYDVISDYQSRMWQVRGVDNINGALRVGGNYQVYAYRFDWDEEGSFLFTNYSTLLGAAHSWEIPFVFANWNYAGRLDRVIWNDRNREGRLALSDTMMGYWAEFARTGNPGTGGSDAAWLPHGAAGRIVFDTDADGGVRMEAGELTPDILYAQMLTDDRLHSQEETCLTYQAVVAWWPNMAPDEFMDGACEG